MRSLPFPPEELVLLNREGALAKRFKGSELGHEGGRKKERIPHWDRLSHPSLGIFSHSSRLSKR
jgi:hypothetical protein